MTIECFLDTNILVYAAIGKRDEPAKFAGARDLLLDLSFGVSARRCSIPRILATSSCTARCGPSIPS